MDLLHRTFFVKLIGTIKMNSLPADIDLVLVAILPDPKDLELARLLGWYRIP